MWKNLSDFDVKKIEEENFPIKLPDRENKLQSKA